ncbi:uncharacterized protein LAJ45_11712 [Morchella importuna]|uniref:uncharacterized protein n=1 Tax=Morchella importuna TaxID=1174673 RepID=UPI001E8D2219|nr:uncharacterized protein LAJ45_11712 [Morchella importuna]KAH8144316.1 hypothetical protein LAJ45_11712 [Morchella importuna]
MVTVGEYLNPSLASKNRSHSSEVKRLKSMGDILLGEIMVVTLMACWFALLAPGPPPVLEHVVFTVFIAVVLVLMSPGFLKFPRLSGLLVLLELMFAIVKYYWTV